MQDAFGYLVFGVVILAVVVAVVGTFASGKTYDQIGRGGLDDREDRGARPRGPATSTGTRAERDAEIRQMLTASNARRERRGQAPLDIDDEVRRLTAPAVDPGLRAEVRELVLARNARRERMGKAPLDVDAEVERQLRASGA